MTKYQSRQLGMTLWAIADCLLFSGALIDAHAEKLDALTTPKRNSIFDDQWAYHLSMQELQQKALRILKMARCGLTYLSLAVHREESLRRSQTPDGIAVPMSLPRWE